MTDMADYDIQTGEGREAPPGSPLYAFLLNAETTTAPTVCLDDEADVEDDEADESDGAAKEPPAIPLDHLPPVVQDFVKCVMASYSLPHNAALISALTVAGAAIGGNVTSKIVNYVNAPCLWTMLVAPPSAGKSAPIAEMIKPMADIDGELQWQYRQQLEAWTAAETMRKSRELNPVEKPVKTAAMIGSATGAARLKLLEANPRGLLACYDEIAALFEEIDSYGGTGDATALMTAYDGGLIKVDRKTDGETIRIPHPFIPIIGGIQPGVLREVITPKMIRNGMSARFTPLIYEVAPGSRRDRPEMSPIAAQRWAQLIRRLYNYGASERRFTATPEAVQRYRDHEENVINEGETPNPDKSRQWNEYKQIAYSKSIYAITRLILIAHVLRIVEGDFPEMGGEIQPGTVDWAFEAAPYICRSMMAAYELATGDAESVWIPKNKGELVRAIQYVLTNEGKRCEPQKIADALDMLRPSVSRILNAKGKATK